MFFKRKDERAIRKQAQERARRYKEIQAQVKKYREELGLSLSEEFLEGAMFGCCFARKCESIDLNKLNEFEKEIERECAKWRIYRTLLKQLGAKQ